MALFELEIKKNWFTGSNIGEVNWDNIRTPLLEWAYDTNRNFEQIAKDCFGTSYVYDNDGAPNRTTPLIDAACLLDGNEHITGTWTFDAIADLGSVADCDINGGSIDGTTVGATTPAAGTFTTITVSTATRYYAVPAAAFICENGSQEADRTSNAGVVVNVNGAFALRYFITSVNLPHGAVVTSLKSYFYRDDAASSLVVYFVRYDGVATTVEVAACTSASTAGNHSVEDTTIVSGTIDNSQYTYSLLLEINNNNATTDAKCYMVVITYTITTPLP